MCGRERDADLGSLRLIGRDPHGAVPAQLPGGAVERGDPEAVAKVISGFRVYAKKVPLKDGDYTMDHTALVYLMDRDGRFVAPFNLKRTPEEAAADLRRYLAGDYSPTAKLAR